MRHLPPVRAFSPGRCFVLALLVVVIAAGAFARPASAFRLVAYNLLNYDNLDSVRNPAFQTVISGIGNVDILSVEEMQDATAVNGFLNNVLNVIEPGQWAAATFFNDPQMSFNQALFYRTSTITFVSADTIGNYPRDISYFRLRPKPYTSSAAEIIVFATHFKASSGSDNEQTRYEEAQRLRTFMNNEPAGTNMIVCGDFNMYTSSENAYQELTGSQSNNIGRVQDPINTPGDWHNSYTYRMIHTQSTRTGYLDPGDGGSTGGMDDRFDFILPTYSLADGDGVDQIASTYTAYGQDGNHFNANINDAPTNTAVGQTIADALQRASDHLPVFLDFQVPAIVSADASLSFGTVIVGATAQQTLTVENIATAPADELNYTLVAPTGFTAPGGSFQDVAGGGGNAHTITMLTSTEGSKAGNLVINSNDVDTPAKNVPLSGTVLRHAVPSLSASSVVQADTLDFGVKEEGQFTNETVSVANYGYDSLQALLNVYDAQITGGEGRFSLVNAFSPVDVGDTAALFEVAFDDSGSARAADTTYIATLTFSDRDQQGIAGGTNLSDLTVYLKATVKAQNSTGVGDPTGPRATLLRASFPNPFQSSTHIRFSLARSSMLRLTIFDVHGRVVRTLLDEWTEQGTYDQTWNGRTDGGHPASPGVYFYRLQTPDYSATRRMIKLR